MPVFEVTDKLGRTLELEGDKEPTPEVLDTIFTKTFPTPPKQSPSGVPDTPSLRPDVPLPGQAIRPGVVGKPPQATDDIFTYQQQQLQDALSSPEETAFTQKIQQPNVRVPSGMAVTGNLVPGLAAVQSLLPKSAQELGGNVIRSAVGMEQALREILEGQTSYENLAVAPLVVAGGAEAGALKGAGVLGKSLAAGFGLQGAQSLLQQSPEFAAAVQKGDWQDASRLATGILASGAQAGLGFYGLRGQPRSLITREDRLLMAPRIRMPELSDSTYEEAALRVQPTAPAARQLPAPRILSPEFTESTRLEAARTGQPSEAVQRIELPVEPETAAKARKVWSKEVDPEAQLEGAEALRQLASMTEETKTPGQPYKPPTVNVDLRQLERMMQRNTVSKVETWADDTVRKKLTEMGANPYFDPEFLAAASVKAAILAKRGVTAFAEFSDAMLKQFGPGIADRLPSLFEQAQRYVKPESVEVGKTPPKTVPPVIGSSKRAKTAAQAQPPVASNLAQPPITPPPIIPPPKAAMLDNAGDSLWTKAGNVIKGMAGESMPKTTTADRMAGELGVRWASSHIAAPYQAQAFHQTVLQGGVDPVRFGAALTEDNLRSVRQGFVEAGQEEQANAVGTLIGRKGSPFATEEQYQAYLARPDVQAAIKRHTQLWDQYVEPMYKRAAQIDPDEELASRGLQTGARINLFVPQEGGIDPKTTVSAAPRLTATFERKTPFARQAKGTGTYGVDYRDMMGNTYAKQLDIANQNAFNQRLVDSGNAVIGPAGQRPVLKGEETTAFPLKRNLFVTQGDEGTKTFPQIKNIYVRRSLAPEYTAAANPFGTSGRTPFNFGKVAGAVNRAALAGLTDFTVHVSNLATVLMTRPASGNIMSDMLLSGAGRADILVSGVKAIQKAVSNNSRQLAELAEIGALRQPHGGRWTGKVIEKMDETVRLVMDDVYKDLAKQGLVEQSETARREFVNQVGQYNKRLQGQVVRTLRDWGVSPFITAGKTFNTLGVRNMLLDPGAKGASPALRAVVASKWLGTIGVLGTLNYMLTADKGGGVMGRPGVPLGRLDTGMVNENGQPLTIPFLDVVGFGRGLRVTGVRATADALRWGLPLQTALDSGVRDVVNSAIAPAVGPLPRLAVGGTTGRSVGMNLPRQYPVVQPGENQVSSDFAHALGDANPVVGSIIDLGRTGGSATAALQRQLPRFTLQPGRPQEMMENYTEIVRRAQLYTYTDDLVHRARRMPESERAAYIDSELNKLEDDSEREFVEKALEYRKVEY